MSVCAQLIVGAKCSVRRCIGLLSHFESNCVLNLSYDAERGNAFRYYFDYFIYYGFKLSNSARSLRSVWIITKKTSSAQNHDLLRALCRWLERSKMALLHIRLLVQFAWWSTPDLMECVSILSRHRTVFGRDAMSYQIMMPLAQSPLSAASRPLAPPNDLKEDLLGHGHHDEVERNTLKGIDSHVRQQNVGKLQVVRSPEGEIAVIEKLRVDAESKQKYQICHEFLSAQNEGHRALRAQRKMQCGGGCDDRQIYNEKIADSVLSQNGHSEMDAVRSAENERMFVADPLRERNDSMWINHCYYCDLVK